MKYIVVFGGAFNPVHNGHIKMAEAAANIDGVDKVLVIPSYLSPHKLNDSLLPAVHRLEMCRLAFKKHPKIYVSDLELLRKGKSYTVDTLKEVRRLYPEYTLKLLIGADMLVKLESWYRFDEIIKLTEILAVSRPGISNSEMLEAISKLKKRCAKIQLLEIPECDISSTEIRQRLAEGKSLKGYLPGQVIDYINQNNLYKMVNNLMFDDKNFEEYKNLIQQKLSGFRYEHSLAVADKAVELARKYGADEEKAYLAGLLHDILKEANLDEQLKIIGQFDIILTEVEKYTPKCWHAIAAAAYVKNVLNIQDEEILSAIRYHTTAKKDMSLLDKILYLADFTSADRDYEGVEDMREAVDKDLDYAMFKALKFTVSELSEKGRPIHPDSIEAYNSAAISNIKKGLK